MNTLEAFTKLEEIETFIKGKLDSKNLYFWPIIKSWIWRYFYMVIENNQKLEKFSRLLKNSFLFFTVL